MFFETELVTDIFKTIYLEDYIKIKKEAEEIKKKAEKFRLTGNEKAYLKKLQEYDVYMLTADTMLSVAIKRPLAEA